MAAAELILPGHRLSDSHKSLSWRRTWAKSLLGEKHLCKCRMSRFHLSEEGLGGTESPGVTEPTKREMQDVRTQESSGLGRRRHKTCWEQPWGQSWSLSQARVATGDTEEEINLLWMLCWRHWFAAFPIGNAGELVGRSGDV